MAENNRIPEQKLPGMNRAARFAAVEYADDIAGTLKRIFAYFAKEKFLVISMLVIVLFGTLCGI